MNKLCNDCAMPYITVVYEPCYDVDLCEACYRLRKALKCPERGRTDEGQQSSSDATARGEEMDSS